MTVLSPLHLRVFRTLALARQVHHYYWVHTDGDEDANGRVSVENLQHIIERLIQLPIKKKIVPFEGAIVRGIFERYPDHIRIYVRAGMSEGETRYIAVKEMCHGLADQESEYCKEGVRTIHELVKYRSLRFDGEETAAVRSERFAEFLAQILLYPLELRDMDYKAVYVDKTTTIAKVAEKRGLPPYLIEWMLEKEFLDACSEAATLVAEKIEFDPLKPFPEKKE